MINRYMGIAPSTFQVFFSRSILHVVFSSCFCLKEHKVVFGAGIEHNP